MIDYVLIFLAISLLIYKFKESLYIYIYIAKYNFINIHGWKFSFHSFNKNIEKESMSTITL